MAGPAVTLAPTNPKPGDQIVATVVRDIPGSVVAVDISTAGGTGHGSIPVAEPYTVADKSTSPHTWSLVPGSDDGTTFKLATTA